MATNEDESSKKAVGMEEWSLEEELEKNKQLHKEDFDTLKKFVSTLPGVEISTITDNLIVALLHSSDYDLTKARHTASTYFATRFSVPEIFTDRDLNSKDMQTALEVGCYCPLPKRTPEGYRIILQALRNKDASVYDHVALTKVQVLTVEACIHEDPTCPGYLLIVDLHGISTSHLWKSNFSVTKKLMKFSQEGSAIKIKQMHLLNSSSFTYHIMRWLKRFLSKQIYDMFQLYTADQMDEFRKAVPKEYLPEDYGGDLPKLNTLCDEQTAWLRVMQPKIEFSPKKA